MKVVVTLTPYTGKNYWKLYITWRYLILFLNFGFFLSQIIQNGVTLICMSTLIIYKKKKRGPNCHRFPAVLTFTCFSGMLSSYTYLHTYIKLYHPITVEQQDKRFIFFGIVSHVLKCILSFPISLVLKLKYLSLTAETLNYNVNEFWFNISYN